MKVEVNSEVCKNQGGSNKMECDGKWKWKLEEEEGVDITFSRLFVTVQYIHTLRIFRTDIRQPDIEHARSRFFFFSLVVFEGEEGKGAGWLS